MGLRSFNVIMCHVNCSSAITFPLFVGCSSSLTSGSQKWYRQQERGEGGGERGEVVLIVGGERGEGRSGTDSRRGEGRGEKGRREMDLNISNRYTVTTRMIFALKMGSDVRHFNVS